MRIGSLCTGYGGLDMATEAAFGATTAWVSDIDKGACKILAHRYPDIPNLGDMTQINWADVEPVDIITGGTPCQDLSHAGKRAGMTEGTRSNLWVQMREAIATIRPTFVVWENVRGAYSAAADSDLEWCPGCMGDPGDRGPVLRALGRVLGDLSELGFDAEWRGIRAADVGAPHGRFRVFVVARSADSRGETGQLRAGLRPSPPDGLGRGLTARGSGPDGDLSLLPSPRATDGTKGGPNQRGSSGDLMLPSAVTLLPTPNPFHATNEEEPDAWRKRRADVFVRTGTRHGPALGVVAKSIEAGDPMTPDDYAPRDEPLLGSPRAAEWKGTGPVGSKSHSHRLERGYLDAQVLMLPTPSAASASGGQTSRSGTRSDELLLGGIVTQLLPTPTAAAAEHSGRLVTKPHQQAALSAEVWNRWGDYAPAITRWQDTIGRPSPEPTEPTGRNGAPRLSASFTEWMMGVPQGWITDTPGLTRNEALKACGNGVVPQQAYAAITDALAAFEATA